MYRLGQVQGGPAHGEGAIEKPGGWSRGRCRLGHVQGDPAPGEGAM
mgnify:CR=1 FL=1